MTEISGSVSYQKAELPPLISKEVHSKYTIRDRLPPVAREGLALKPSCSSSYFLHLTKTWDQGNRTVRERILKEFIASNQSKTGPQLEKELGNGASLFLTRITAWLRLTYLLGHHIALQLQAINIFISASSGNRFLAEFLEVGGVLTVLEILGIPQSKEPDKAEALRVLLFISSNGRKYKEFICESFGVRSISECLTKSKSEVTQDYARNLLYQLGTGNPKFVLQVYKSLLAILNSPSLSPAALQMAAQALRMLLPNINSLPLTIVESSSNLLRHGFVQVQYEGYELLKDLIQRTSLQEHIIKELIGILRIVITDDSDDNDPRSRRPKALGEVGKSMPTAWNATGAKDDQKAIQSMFVQQAYAAKLLSFAAASSHDLAERMIQQQVVGALLNTIANVGHVDSQRYATNLLLFFAHQFEYVVSGLCDQMGRNFYDLIEAKPDTFYRELTKEQVKYLRKNNVKITDGHRNKVNDSENPATSEEGTTESNSRKPAPDKASAPVNMFPSTNDEDGMALEDSDANEFGSDILVDETHTAMVEEYEREQESNERQLVEEIYTPFVQKSVTNTFSGTKYHAASSSDANQKFASDLEKLRIAQKKEKDKKGQSKKEEFPIELETDLQSKITNIRNDPTIFAASKAPVALPAPPSPSPPDELAQTYSEILKEEDEDALEEEQEAETADDAQEQES